MYLFQNKFEIFPTILMCHQELYKWTFNFKSQRFPSSYQCVKINPNSKIVLSDWSPSQNWIDCYALIKVDVSKIKRVLCSILLVFSAFLSIFALFNSHYQFSDLLCRNGPRLHTDKSVSCCSQSVIVRSRANEKMSCEESAISLANFAYIPHI